MVQGKYCLYEASKDQWLGTGGGWMPHRVLKSHILPKEYQLNTSSYGSSIDFTLVPSSETIHITTEDYDLNIKSFEVMTFSTVKEAEDYIMNNEHLIVDDGFVSIRKIYISIN